MFRVHRAGTSRRLLVVAVLCGIALPVRAAEIPVTVRQIVIGDALLVGHDLVVEVLFNYIASLQDRSEFLKCSVEGKFRLSGAAADAGVLYKVYLRPAAFLATGDLLVPGEKLTLHCRILEPDGRWSPIEVSRIEAGWASEAPDLPAESPVEPDGAAR